MTFTFNKKFVAFVALSTVCFGSTAHAADAFNKFPTQQATTTTQTQRTAPVRAEATLTQSRVQTYSQTRRVNRVVEPVQAPVVAPSEAPATVSFNKMQSQTTVSRDMPVMNRRLVVSR